VLCRQGSRGEMWSPDQFWCAMFSVDRKDPGSSDDPEQSDSCEGASSADEASSDRRRPWIRISASMIFIAVAACISVALFPRPSGSYSHIDTTKVVRRSQTDVVSTTLIGMVGLPDFSGHWKLVKMEGDMDAFMKNLKYPWWKRKVAATVHYGTNVIVQNIKQTGTTMEVQEVGPAGIYTSTISVGGGPGQSWFQGDGNPVKIEPYWDGRYVVMKTTNLDGTRGPKVSRYLKDGDMVELSVLGGVTVKQSYTPV